MPRNRLQKRPKGQLSLLSTFAPKKRVEKRGGKKQVLIDLTNETSEAEATDAPSRRHAQPPRQKAEHPLLRVLGRARRPQHSVPGFAICEDFITPEEEQELFHACRRHGRWQNKPDGDTGRRMWEFGPPVDKAYRVTIDPSEFPPLPAFVTEPLLGTEPLLDRIVAWCTKERIMERARRVKRLPDRPLYFDSIFVNEYIPGAGLHFHADRRDAFEELIVAVSLGADTHITFRPINAKGGVQTVHIPLPRRSLWVMTGSARYNFEHGIDAATLKLNAPCTRDYANGTRVSITFRAVRRTHARPPRRDPTQQTLRTSSTLKKTEKLDSMDGTNSLNP
ncbi:MAG: hypothetical protein MHM6MM_004953 [Cercozoa sp. M6MM]